MSTKKRSEFTLLHKSKLITYFCSKTYSSCMEFDLTVLFISTALTCRNVVDLSMSAQKGDALTTTTNPAYEMMKQGGRGGGQGRHEYELVGGSPGTDPFVAKGADKTYEMLSPPFRQLEPTIPLSVAPPTSGDVGVAKEEEAEGVYDNIPGDQ